MIKPLKTATDMVNETFNNMSATELKSLIQVKEKEYREAIRAKKVFWEVKRILKEKRKIEGQLIKQVQ